MTAANGGIAIRPRNFYNDVMKIACPKSICGLLIIFSIFTACSQNQSGNSSSSAGKNTQNYNSDVEVIAQDNVEDLGKIIKLPFTPIEATYSETNLNTKNTEPRVPASNEKKFVGVLRFTSEDAAKIVSNAEKYKLPVPSDIDAETWFPPELIAKSQETGDDFLKGTEYAADDFLQPPYSKGKLTRINNTDYYILELSSF